MHFHMRPPNDMLVASDCAIVMQLVEELRPHGLTLLNYASIREQSIGGFTQVLELPPQSPLKEWLSVTFSSLLLCASTLKP